MLGIKPDIVAVSDWIFDTLKVSLVDGLVHKTVYVLSIPHGDVSFHVSVTDVDETDSTLGGSRTPIGTETIICCWFKKKTM